MVLVTLVLVSLSGNNAAWADRNSHIGSISYRYGGYNYGHGSYYQPPHRSGYYYPPSYGYSRHHNVNNDAAYALGGMVVGSLLTNTYIQQPYVQQGRRLLKDIHGRCYERITDVAGNELLTELSPSSCNW